MKSAFESALKCEIMWINMTCYFLQQWKCLRAFLGNQSCSLTPVWSFRVPQFPAALWLQGTVVAVKMSIWSGGRNRSIPAYSLSLWLFLVWITLATWFTVWPCQQRQRCLKREKEKSCSEQCGGSGINGKTFSCCCSGDAMCILPLRGNAFFLWKKWFPILSPFNYINSLHQASSPPHGGDGDRTYFCTVVKTETPSAGGIRQAALSHVLFLYYV